MGGQIYEQDRAVSYLNDIASGISGLVQKSANYIATNAGAARGNQVNATVINAMREQDRIQIRDKLVSFYFDSTCVERDRRHPLQRVSVLRQYAHRYG